MDIAATTRRIDSARRAAEQLDGAIQSLENIWVDSQVGFVKRLLGGSRDQLLRERIGTAAAQAEEGARILQDAGVDPDGIRHLRYAERELRRIQADPDIADTLNHRLTAGFWGTRSTLTDELRAVRAAVRIVPLTNPVAASKYELGTTLRNLAEGTLSKPDGDLTFDDLVFLDRLGEFDKASRLGMNMPGANAPVPYDYRSLLADPRDADRITNGLVSRWHSASEWIRHVVDRSPEDTPAVVAHLAELRSWVTRSRQLQDAVEGRGEVPTDLKVTDLPFLLSRIEDADPAVRQRAVELVEPAHRSAVTRHAQEMSDQAQAAHLAREEQSRVAALSIQQLLDEGRISTIPVARAALDDAALKLSTLDAGVGPELRPLVDSTRSLIDLNFARMAGKVGDGYAAHPKYEEIGQVRSNVALLEAVSKIRLISTAANEKVLDWTFVD